ncbi:MFS transporter [Thioclava sp. FR2]|uniref:MFS transporter n=1 Tax=Thioclava sp. FR2 TaxID=3445780 RepID=UPI003EC09917
MMLLESAQRSERLWPWSIFAAMIAMAGIPIYIHAPKFYVDEYGVGLAGLGVVLALLRLIDVVQDPLLGWLAEQTKAQRKAMVTGAAAVMAVSMIGLFAVPPLLPPLLWFSCTLGGLFTSFSFLTIVFYAEGVGRAKGLGEGGHLRLAGWRETGSLIGVSLAAMAPVVLARWTEEPFALFALCFAVFSVSALAVMLPEWETEKPANSTKAYVFESISTQYSGLKDPVLRRLLLLAVVNASPVAVTSTLFLFFVDSRLDAAGWEGPLLLLYFLSAAVAAPVWSALAGRIGARSALIVAMSLSIAAFVWTANLEAGDLVPFAVICAVTGFAVGADFTLLPAMFSRRLARLAQGGETSAFGMWSFASKLSLALAAAVLLPLLEAKGFASGAANGPDQMALLTLLYAALPCGLKIVALGLVMTFDKVEER